MKVLVIIVSYNFEPWLHKCLDSLRQSHYPVSVLVVDNGSSDNTVNRLREEYPDVLLIANDDNLGFGAANNIGLEYALAHGYEAVFLLNQDAWIGNDVVGELVRLSKKYVHIGILSPVHLHASGVKPDGGSSQYAGIGALEELPSEEECVALSFVNAAFWFIPTRVLRRVGFFSPLFFHYGEDKDYVNRLFYHGFGVAYSPRVMGYHDRESIRGDFLYSKKYLHLESVYFLSEYANVAYPFYKSVAYGVLAPIKKAYLAACARRRHVCGEYLKMSMKLCASTLQVLCHRKRYRNKYQYQD